MERFAESIVKRQLFTTLVLWSLIVVYASARFLQAFPGRVPMLAIVALHVLPPLLFAFLHGAMLYGLRGILTFFALCVAIGGLIETFGVLTGFPFGHYYFTDVMGPKIFVVPIFLGLAYVGMGYLSWTLASVILGALPNSLTGSRVRDVTAACSPGHGRVGPVHGSHLGYGSTRVDMAAGRSVFRCSAQQLPWLVSDGLHHLPVVRTLPANAGDQSKFTATRLLAACHTVLRRFRRRKSASARSQAGTFASYGRYRQSVAGQQYCRGLRLWDDLRDGRLHGSGLDKA